MHKLFFVLILSIFCFCACREQQLNEAVLPIYEQDYLFVEADLVKAEAAKVFLKRTVPPTADSTPALSVGDAKVFLFEEGQMMEELQEGISGYYRSNVLIEEGNTYHIEVETEDLGDAKTARETIPAFVSWRNYSLAYNADSSEVTIEADFIEDLNQKNYYALKTILVLEDGREMIRQVAENSNAIISGLEYPCKIEITGTKGTLISDACTSDPIMNISYQIPTKITELDSSFLPVFYQVEQIQLMLSHLSFSSFEHLKTKRDQQFSTDDPFSDPVPVFMNMEEGFGILKTSSVDSLIFSLD